jgi:hypothetical protein
MVSFKTCKRSRVSTPIRAAFGHSKAFSESLKPNSVKLAHVTTSPGNSQTKCCSGLSKRLAEVGITIHKNVSILGFSSNPTKKVSSK